VPVPERIATFDNDGTLWCEQPNYVQAVFVIDRIKALAPQHPEWKTTELFKSVLEGNFKEMTAKSEDGIAALIAATHGGTTVDEFDAIVKDWLAKTKHPRFDRPYTACVYQPMLELLAYLRGNGFKTFIVSGGGVEFIRAFADKVYGVPPEQVIGSTIKTKFEVRDGKPVLVRLGEIDFIDDGPGKPVGIQTRIGRRPVMAFGNSDGDFQMLEYTTAGPGARFGLYVHHTDAVREYAYDRNSPIGRLARGLDEAAKRGWVVTSMKDDWKTIFPPLK
jgi:phosphoserine phosphatase